MKYLCTIYAAESKQRSLSPDEQQAMFHDYMAFNDAAKKTGVHLAGEGLQPIATATTARVRDGKASITDGPFAETKEQLGGFYLLDCKDLDEALSWAKRIPTAKWGSVEVRPVMVFDQ